VIEMIDLRVDKVIESQNDIRLGLKKDVIEVMASS
jgi:hypothetical protein